MGIVSMETLRVEIARVTAELSASLERERVLREAVQEVLDDHATEYLRVDKRTITQLHAALGGSDGN